MLGNCEKMLGVGVLISSPPPNGWPQNINHIDDPKQSLNNNNNPNMASLAATITTTPTSNVVERIMDQKVGTTTTNIAQQDQQKQDQAIIRCPRCDSTNTKFCYYNNYSLSQPRHFCKACKRYWTKGGTLRNVPVGGGCRKNKRVKRPSNNNSSSSSNNTTINNNNNASLEGSVNSATSSIGGGCGLSSLSSSPGAPIHDLLSSASNHHQSHHPLFYGFPTSNINFPFSRYDLQNPPPINGLGLGFSSGLVHNMNNMNIHHGSDNDNNNNNNNNTSNNNSKVFQDLISSNPVLSDYATTTTTTTAATTTTTTPPTISSLLGSSLHQMKGGNNNNNNFHTLLPSYEDNDDLHMKGSEHNEMYMKEVKMELQGQNRSFDNHHWDTTNTAISTQNQMDHHHHHHHRSMVSSSDPSILWGSNTGANLSTWLDPTNNLGSSVPSLI